MADQLDRQSDPTLERIRQLVRLWDEAVRLPLLGPVGLDALVGLVPAVGDLAGAVVSVYLIVLARRSGAPGAVLAQMTLTVVTDVVVGTVPLVGDLFDVGWKANRRNYDLLLRWKAAPERTARTSALALSAAVAGSVGAVALVVWLLVLAVRALVR